MFNHLVPGFSSLFLETQTLSKKYNKIQVLNLSIFFFTHIEMEKLIFGRIKILHLEFHSAIIQFSNSCKNSKIGFQCFSNKKQTKWSLFYYVIVLKLIPAKIQNWLKFKLKKLFQKYSIKWTYVLNLHWGLSVNDVMENY